MKINFAKALLSVMEKYMSFDLEPHELGVRGLVRLRSPYRRNGGVLNYSFLVSKEEMKTSKFDPVYTNTENAIESIINAALGAVAESEANEQA